MRAELAWLLSASEKRRLIFILMSNKPRNKENIMEFLKAFHQQESHRLKHKQKLKYTNLEVKELETMTDNAVPDYLEISHCDGKLFHLLRRPRLLPPILIVFLLCQLS
jgi:hypothetical protein